MKKKLLLNFLQCFIFLCLAGCSLSGDETRREITGRYYVDGDGDMENVHLVYEDSRYGFLELIGAPIVAVGHSDSHIIARRAIGEGGQYYILSVVSSGTFREAEEGVSGPLEKEEFEAKLKELGLYGSIEFEKEFEAE